MKRNFPYFKRYAFVNILSLHYYSAEKPPKIFAFENNERRKFLTENFIFEKFHTIQER